MKNYKFLILLIALIGPFAYFILRNNKIDHLEISKKTIPVKDKIVPHAPKIYSLLTTPSKEKKVPRIFGRKIMGLGNKKLPKNLKTVNKYNPMWKNHLTKYLLKFQNPSVDVNVKLNDAYIMIKNNQGRFVEEVIINYLEKGERISSFRAIVDSETGFILNTFDKITIQERRRPYPRLSPTGSIKNSRARRIKKD